MLIMLRADFNRWEPENSEEILTEKVARKGGLPSFLVTSGLW